MTDVFEEMSAAVEQRPGRDGTVKRSGVLYCGAPAVNSLEMCIHVARITDPTFSNDLEFIEIENENEPAAPPRAPATPEDERFAQARSALASLYIEHESIARSLGPETRDIYQRYCAVCESEGLVPLYFHEYSKWRPR
jgi:hypothetical protein